MVPALHVARPKVTEGLVDRAIAAGFAAVVLTVDLPMPGYSPRAARAPIGRPTRSVTSICRARRWPTPPITPIQN